MPAVSPEQRTLMAIGEHHPDQVYPRNRGILKMSKGQLHDFAATKGLGPVKHDTAPAGGFAHQGSTVEGPEFRGAKREGATFTTGAHEDKQQFKWAGTTKEGPTHGHAAASGRSADGPTRGKEPPAFKYSGTTKEGYYTTHCATDAQAAPDAGTTVTHPTIRRAGSDEHSGNDSGGGFRHHLTHASQGHSHGRHDGGEPDSRAFATHEHMAPREHPRSESVHGLHLGRDQAKGVGHYEGGRENQDSPVDAIRGLRGQQGPKRASGAREGRHAFKMAVPEFKGDKWLGKARASMERRGTVGSFTRSAKAAGQGVQEHAASVLRPGSHADATQKRRAVFARNMAHLHH